MVRCQFPSIVSEQSGEVLARWKLGKQRERVCCHECHLQGEVSQRDVRDRLHQTGTVADTRTPWWQGWFFCGVHTCCKSLVIQGLCLVLNKKWFFCGVAHQYYRVCVAIWGCGWWWGGGCKKIKTFIHKSDPVFWVWLSAMLTVISAFHGPLDIRHTPLSSVLNW